MCVWAGGGGPGGVGWMGNLHQSDHKSPRIMEGILQTVGSGRPAELTDKEQEDVSRAGAHMKAEAEDDRDSDRMF